MSASCNSDQRTASPDTPGEPPAPRTIPVVEEQLAVGRVSEATGAAVRVRIAAECQTRRLETTDVVDEVFVERVPVDRFVAERSGPREEDGVVIVPVFETVAVVETRLLLKEELRIVRRRREVPHQHEVVVVKERAIVERRAAPDEAWQPEDAPPHEGAAGDRNAI